MEAGIDRHDVAPGKPTQNVFIESLNGKLRDAVEKIGASRIDYDTSRPHSSIGSLRCGKRHCDATGQAAAVHDGLLASPRSANRKNRVKSRTDSTPNRVGSWPQTSGSVPGGWSATAAKPARPRSIYRHTTPAKVKVRSFLSPRSAPYRTDSEPVRCSGPAKSGTCLRSASANCRKRTGIAMQPSIAAARQRAARSRRAFSSISAKGRQSRHHRTLPARRGRRPSGRLSSLDTATKSGAARSATGRRRL